MVVVDDTVQSWTVAERCAELCRPVARPGERVSCEHARLDRDTDLATHIGHHLGVMCVLEPGGAAR